MLALAFAPTVSHALAAQLTSAQPWSELCSLDGGQDAGARLAHCPLCAQPSHTPALPSAPGLSGANAVEAGELPCVAPPGIVPASVWAVPPSRAPPTVVPA